MEQRFIYHHKKYNQNVAVMGPIHRFNATEIAKWCGGRISVFTSECIEILVPSGDNPLPDVPAHRGDYISLLKYSSSFHVLHNLSDNYRLVFP